jgi:hypothetical protein
VGTVETAARPVDRALERRWRDAEAAFFATSISDPDMYQTALALVRGLAAGLRDMTSEAGLEAAYVERGPEWAERRLAELELPEGDWLDLESAREAAFNLRLTELRSEVAARATADRLAAARATGQTWLVDVDGNVGFGGQRTYRRVEIHTQIGVALYGYSAREWGRSETYWFEVIKVDPVSGSRIRGAPPLYRPRARRDRDALAHTFAAARRRYARAS